MEEREDDGVNEDGFMPHCEVVDKSTPNYDTDDEEKREDPNGTYFEYKPVEGPEGEETEPLYFVSREEWGALPPVDPTPNEQFPIKHVVYSMSTRRMPCTSKEECMGVMRRLQKRHLDEGLSDIAYNFMVGRDGTVYEGRGWKVKSAKRLRYNPALYGKRIDIGFIGDFHGMYMPPLNMLEGSQNIQRLGIEENFLLDGHQVTCIYTERRRIRQGYNTHFPTAEEYLHQKEHPPDEFELPPIWVPKKTWKGL